MMRVHRFVFPLLAVVAAGLTGCENGGTDPEDRVPAAVNVVSGNAQQGTAGQPLPQPVQVRVVDDRGRPVPGAAVNFVVTAGGGTVAVATATTDADGRATTQWTLGTQAGAAQTLEARVSGAGGSVVTSGPITATVRAGPAARLVAVSDSVDMGGAVGGPARDSLVVRVLDAHGNPVPGATVSWGIGEGGGSVSPASATSDAQGLARTQWTLGPQTNVVQAAVASATGTNQVAFTGRAGNLLLKLAGDGVTATAGTAVNVVVSLNGDGAGPVPGARVHWTVLTGGGSVTPATSITERQFGPTIGQASAQWTLGAAAGPQTLRASVGPLQQTFTVNVIGLGTRTLVAQVPGRALDVSADRVLWVDSAGGTRVIKVRSRATGADQTVKVDSQASPFPVTGPFTAGWLFPGGALVSGGAPARWVEWRGGALTELGSDIEQMSVHGSWAAWRTGSQVLRRNLATGVTDVVASSGAADVDAAPNGDVAYVAGGGVFLYSGGVSTPVSTEPPSAQYTPQRAGTDGVNVVYRLFSFFGSSALLFLDQPGGDLLLAGATETHGGFLQFLLEGGWIAYRGSTPAAVGNVWRRSPAGAVEHLTTTGLLRGLAPDGTVVYELTPTQRYRLVAPGGVQSDVGIAASTDLVVPRDGELYLLSGGSVFELGP